jgi:hypothetical protein
MFLFLFFGALELEAWARAGGGRSFGGGSSRSFSTPYRGYSSPSQRNESRSYQAPSQPAAPSAPGSQPWGGGGFLRGLAGGIAGGFLGSLLFSSLGYAGGWGGLGGIGGGIGLLEILLFAGIAFVTIHFVANLLDYTVEEGSGRIVGGSKDVPVKFEEYWTFARPSGGSSWQLTAIQQPE